MAGVAGAASETRPIGSPDGDSVYAQEGSWRVGGTAAEHSTVTPGNGRGQTPETRGDTGLKCAVPSMVTWHMQNVSKSNCVCINS